MMSLLYIAACLNSELCCIIWLPFQTVASMQPPVPKMQPPGDIRAFVSNFKSRYTSSTTVDTMKPTSQRGGFCCRTVDITHFLMIVAEWLYDMYALVTDDFRIYWHSTEGMIAHNATPSRSACASIGETCASIGVACKSIRYTVKYVPQLHGGSMFLLILIQNEEALSGAKGPEGLEI